MSIKLAQKWEDLDVLPIPASTVFNFGDGLTYNGSGSVIVALPGMPLAGFGLTKVASTDPDYASATKQIAYQKAGSVGHYRFQVPVGAGTALASMIGGTYNLSASDAGAIDLTAYKTFTYNTLAVSTFAVGHTVTGGTSGATGVIIAVNTLLNGSQQIVVGTITGTFVAGETLTDGTSSATAKLITIVPQGTQLKIESVLSTTLVECTVALAA